MKISQTFLRKLTIIISLSLAPIMNASAINALDFNAIVSDYPFYDPTLYCGAGVPDGMGGCKPSCPSGVSAAGGGATNSAPSTPLVGGDNPTQIWNFFIGKGLKPFQAAGIMGNIQAESVFDPFIIEGGSHSTNPAAAGSGGYGIVQWTPGSKLIPLLNGKPVSLASELDALWTESASQQALNEVKSSTNIADATNFFLHDFEKPAVSIQPQRTTNAQNILAKYGNGATSGTSSSSSSSSSGSSGSSSSANCAAAGGAAAGGGASVGANGFVFYSQYDPTWASHSYGGSTIASSGCAPTSMAEIVSTLTGQSVTPIATADYAASKGLIGAGGSSTNLAAILAPHWNLKVQSISRSAAGITAALKSGALVIMGGQGASPFTSAGHVIAVRAVAPDGNWLLGDPNVNPPAASAPNNTKEWTPSSVVGVPGTFAYAITK